MRDTKISLMAETIHCHEHGECEMGYLCKHLSKQTAGLGFNRAEPTEEEPFPDAWCDDCNLIYEAHDGWTDEAQKLCEISLVCAACYERARIRNLRTDVSFEELASLRWKCGSCEEWHYGPCLDFTYDAPLYWTEENEAANQNVLLESGFDKLPTNLLNEDVCVIDDHYFVRGLIDLPIVGTNETFSWGVWGSLSRENFEKLMKLGDDPQRAELPPMFSWLSNSIDEYPETLNLKMYAHIQEPPYRPIFELEPTDHPLSREYYQGITPERVKDIMMRRLDLPVN